MEATRHVEHRLAESAQMARSERETLVAPTASREAFELKIGAYFCLGLIANAIKVEHDIWLDGASRVGYAFRHFDHLAMVICLDLLDVLNVNSFLLHVFNAFIAIARLCMETVQEHAIDTAVCDGLFDHLHKVIAISCVVAHLAEEAAKPVLMVDFAVFCHDQPFAVTKTLVVAEACIHIGGELDTALMAFTDKLREHVVCQRRMAYSYLSIIICSAQIAA